MRCIESLIHLCAMGMFDDTDIHLLALDTDKNNGNFSRLKETAIAYMNIKGVDKANRVALSDTFFSANIHYYEFAPNYEQRSTFRDVFNYGDTQYNHREQTDLADLVLTDNVEEFNLRHGYRAQTHLGSMMMYHSIIEAARSPLQSDIKSYLQNIITASQNGNPRVFILGSVFGGTGASSIPIVPQALSKAAAILSNGAVNVLQSCRFGSTLLTSYFSFKNPSSQELAKQRVIATSDKFALNSQVAMMFYDDDTTVRNTYQRFYMMGTEGLEWDPMKKDESNINETITGGERQKNDSHYIELLAACSALDFFSVGDSILSGNKQHFTTDYLYRAIDQSGVFDFKDFVSQERENEFARKFGLLIVFALLCNGDDNFVESVRTGRQKEITGFESLDVNQVDYLKKYFRLMFLKKEKDGSLSEGWLFQIHRSAGGGDKFLFNAKLFSASNYHELMKLRWNKFLYREDGIAKDHKYDVSLISSQFDVFKKEFIKKMQGNSSNSITNTAERLYKMIYDTLSVLYKFE